MLKEYTEILYFINSLDSEKQRIKLADQVGKRATVLIFREYEKLKDQEMREACLGDIAC